MIVKLSPSAQQVQNALKLLGVDLLVVELPSSTRSAQEAALAVGCGVGQIVKSLVFKRITSGKSLLILVSGANRVDETHIATLLSEKIEKADAEFVHHNTGFHIGGVPPVGHCQPIETLIDADLLLHAEIWAAAGTPNAVFKLTPAELVQITGGKIVTVK